MYLLAIESSCDETSVALLDSPGNVIGCWTRSQIERHKKWGGVVPEVAARDHLAALDTLVRLALTESGIKLTEISAIGVTRGPGLIGALLVGVQYARTLAALQQIPVYGVNHLSGHIQAAEIEQEVAWPALALLVSGGHTLMVSANREGEYKKYAGTVDDAVGEAYDKVAKLLGLPYPGGPVVMKAAATGNASRFAFPRPLLHSGDGRISMSGLKTAVVRAARECGADALQSAIPDLCAGFQAAVSDVLAGKATFALQQMAEDGNPARSLLFTGGVAANQVLRARLQQVAVEHGLQWCVPSFEYCTDNAAMIGASACIRWQNGEPGDMDLEPLNRWSLG